MKNHLVSLIRVLCAIALLAPLAQADEAFKIDPIVIKPKAVDGQAALFKFTNVFGASMRAMGHATGNGGDHVRASFLRMGEAVLDYLTNTTGGAAIVAKHGLDLTALGGTLQARRLDIVEGTLLDNGGVPVDATGSVEKITLDKDRWIEHFEKERDVYFLVFHEMLRSLAVNDDDYVISKSLFPFPFTRRITTRIASVYPIIGDQQISDWFDTEKMNVNGSGCRSGRLGTSADFDFERNILDLSFQNYLLKTSSGAPTDRKACQLAIPIKVPAGQRLVISQMDMTAKLELAARAKIAIAYEAFLAGDRSPVHQRVFESRDEAVVGRVIERGNEVLRTACGGSAILRVNTSALMIAAGGSSSAAGVDRLTLSFKAEPCP